MNHFTFSFIECIIDKFLLSEMFYLGNFIKWWEKWYNNKLCILYTVLSMFTLNMRSFNNNSN